MIKHNYFSVFIFFLIHACLSMEQLDSSLIFQTNFSTKKIQLTGDSTSIQTPVLDSNYLHAELSEFDSNMHPLPANSRSCKIINDSFNLDYLSTSNLPARIVTRPYYIDDRLFVITETSLLLCIELLEGNANIFGQLDLAAINGYFDNAIISTMGDPVVISILTSDSKVIFVNISYHNDMKLLPEKEFNLPLLDDKIFNFFLYKEHMFIANGKKGVRIFDIQNKVKPQLVKTLERFDFKTFSEINITRVWQKNGIMFIINTPKDAYFTYMLNISEIDDGGKIRRLRGEYSIDGTLIDETSFTSRTDFHFGYGATVITEFRDQTLYSQRNPQLNMKRSRTHVLDSDSSIRMITGSNETIIAFTEEKIYFIKTAQPAPRADIPYNLLKYQLNIGSFSDVEFLLLSNKNNSIVGFGSGDKVNVFQIEFLQTKISCRQILDDDYRALAIQLISANCPEVKNHSDICLSNYQMLIANDLTKIPNNYNYPELPLPTLQAFKPIKERNNSSKQNDLEIPKQDPDDEKTKIRSNSEWIAYLIILGLIGFVVLVVLSLLAKKFGYRSYNLKNTSIEFQIRDGKALASYQSIATNKTDKEESFE